MPLIPMAPPATVPLSGGFDYVTVDAVHRRVYAAHTGASTLLIVDADTGAVLHQIRVGPMHGVAYNAAGTKVYTGDGDAKTVSESDPATFRVLRTAAVDGPVDAIAYDESSERIYADEDDGTRIFVIDAKTMRQIGTVALPGHKPEYLAVDPATHAVYQNIADKSEVAVIDPEKLAVGAIVPTPELTSNHPLQYDAGLKQIVVGGANGVLSVYDPSGKKLFQASLPPHVDQCDLDQSTHLLACAGGTGITVLQLSADAAPKTVGTYTGPYRVHTLAFDAKTHDLWAVMVDEGSAKTGYIQRFSVGRSS
jgi:DNA-binding beta-propeller fold protein YncE